MLRNCLFYFLLLQICTLEAQTKPEKLKGLLWEISGNGLSKPGYLYGTMHVSEKMVFNLSDSFFMALRQVEMVALETNHDAWQKFTDNLVQESGVDPFETGVYYANGKENNNLYNESFLFNAPGRDMYGALLSAKPVMTNEFLYRSNDYQQDYEEDTYLDLFIFQAGKKLGKTVVGLETLEGSYEALIRSRIPDDGKDESKRGYFNPNTMNLDEAYRNQDLDLIDSINRITSPGKNFQRWMLDERNKVMVNGIDSILQSGHSLFSAVGAAHLPGETGLIKLLRKKGYTLRPVQFTNTAGLSNKENLDKLHYPVNLSRNWLMDSTWSTVTPGRFYPTMHTPGLEQYLCADMSNGVFYAVYRIKTNGWWTGQSPQYIADRIDSLIYEKIPGKIIDRKRFTEPFPGHEISSRTRRGDVQRFKIFITPFEVIMFTAGGNGDYALGDEVSNFINGIQYTGYSHNNQQVLQPKQGGVKLKFPVGLAYNTTEGTKAGPFFAISKPTQDSSVYFLYRTDYHDFTYIEEDTFELNIIGERIAEQFTKTAPTQTLISNAPYPTQDISFRSDLDSTHFFLRLVIDGPHYYLFGSRQKSKRRPNAFFDSFEITPNKYPAGFAEITDTTLHFRVETLPKEEKPGKAFVEKLRKIYEESRQKFKDTDIGEEYGQKNEQFRVFESPETGELISCKLFTAPSNVMLPSLDSLKNDIKNGLTASNKMALREHQWTEQNGVLIGSFLMEDTNSVRGIRAKVWIINRKTYQMTATVNLKKPESAFIHSLFNTFNPTDTVNGTSLYGQANLSFLHAIYSKDSLERENARKALQEFWHHTVRPEDTDFLISLIEHPEFEKLKFRDKKDLIEALGSTQTPKAGKFLLAFFEQHPDSVRLQLAALESMATIKNKSTLSDLLDLLQNQPIFLDESNNAVMSNFNDSLEMSASLTPKLLKLVDLDFFHDQILNLMLAMLQDGLIKPKVYADLKPQLIRETFWEISGYQYKNEIKRDQTDAYYGDYGPEGGVGNIRRNLNLLGPFLRKDKAVQAVAERALRCGDNPLKIMVYGLYMKHNVPFDKDKLAPFKSDLKTMYPLFQQLAMAGKLSEYTAWFKDTTRLLESYLVTEQANGYAVRSIDSIRLISRHNFVWLKKPAYLYFFEIKQKDSKDWVLAQLTVPKDMKFFTNADSSKGAVGRYLNTRSSYWNRPDARVISNLSEKEKEEYMRRKVGEIRFANRERYRPRQQGNYFSGYD
ncbi:MAG: TraB/GumN family protein [Bacteroidota bacterium]